MVRWLNPIFFFTYKFPFSRFGHGAGHFCDHRAFSKEEMYFGASDADAGAEVNRNAECGMQSSFSGIEPD